MSQSTARLTSQSVDRAQTRGDTALIAELFAACRMKWSKHLWPKAWATSRSRTGIGTVPGSQ